MIIFDQTTWTIHIPPGERMLARQYDNRTRAIVVSGVPEGWDWTLLVQAQGKLDLIHLEPMEDGVGVALTAQQLSLSGCYAIQLRGTQGELVRHTNVVQAIIPASLSGDATWPTVPSAVEQVLQQMEKLNQHPPYPGENGYWMIWDPDTHAYEESGIGLSAALSPILALSGFVPDAGDPSGMTMTLQLSDEQYTQVYAAMQAGRPVSLEGMYLVYPIGDASDSPEFVSGDLGGILSHLSVNHSSKIATLTQRINQMKPIDIGYFTALDVPVYVNYLDAKQGYEFGVPISGNYNGIAFIAHPVEHSRDCYCFANHKYVVTIDMVQRTGTLSER